MDRTPARPFLKTQFYEWGGSVSPNGGWVAYTSNDSGRDEIYVQPFPGGGDRYRVSFAGGSMAKWAADGSELFFVTPNREISAAREKRSDTRFESDAPVVLFRMPGLLPPQTAFRTAYAVAADGRFLMTVTMPDEPPRSITVAANWRE